MPPCSRSMASISATAPAAAAARQTVTSAAAAAGFALAAGGLAAAAGAGAAAAEAAAAGAWVPGLAVLAATLLATAEAATGADAAGSFAGAAWLAPAVETMNCPPRPRMTVKASGRDSRNCLRGPSCSAYRSFHFGIRTRPSAPSARSCLVISRTARSARPSSRCLPPPLGRCPSSLACDCCRSCFCTTGACEVATLSVLGAPEVEAQARGVTSPLGSPSESSDAVAAVLGVALRGNTRSLGVWPPPRAAASSMAMARASVAAAELAPSPPSTLSASARASTVSLWSSAITASQALRPMSVEASLGASPARAAQESTALHQSHLQIGASLQECEMVTVWPNVVESYFLLTCPASAYKISTFAATRFGQCLAAAFCRQYKRRLSSVYQCLSSSPRALHLMISMAGNGASSKMS
mmetsp:Transcript_75016/g.195101  ORF Transcript_75016/g.195101 Transcript_75016/m.195101 type:complete len:412 (-) Transcript_75016:256-1491(-)